MAAIVSWYSSQYASWNRTRRMHAPAFLARTDTQTSRAATAMRQNSTTNANANTAGNPGDVVINMGEPAPTTPVAGDKKDNKDTLFGPNIGIVGSGPKWACDPSEKRIAKKEDEKTDGEDELTPDIVKEWIKRSADPAQPTTTLQALVNLKRPSIRLSPLAHPAPESSGSTSNDSQLHLHQQHGLEFEFDCDAPRCDITLHVIGVPSHLAVGEDHEGDFSRSHEALATVGAGGDVDKDRMQLFEAIVDGGFGRKLPLGAGAALELAKLENAVQAHKKALAAAAAGSSHAAETSQRPEAAKSEHKEKSESHEHPRKRLTFFRKRSHHQASALSTTSGENAQTASAAHTRTAGPALAVVDAEAATHHEPEPEAEAESGSSPTVKEGKSATEDEEGVRVAICLSARDEEGRPLRVRNEQVTYLHIVRHGPAPAPAATITPAEGATSSEGNDATALPEREKTEEVDQRPWVVKVVKREARIGAHAFHLHEIYGLTAHAALTAPSPDSAPTAPLPQTYPPTAAPGTAVGGQADDEAASECLLCLSSPREVVLLPCRHLVACAECAANMVEFGAGGTVVPPTEPEPAPAPAPSAEANGAEGSAPDANNPEARIDRLLGGAGSAPAPAVTVRRKRKAKGWFCPVCRQPYTALLRISTRPPESAKHGEAGPAAEQADGKRLSALSSSEEGVSEAEQEAQPQPPTPTPAATQPATHPLATDAANVV